MVYGTNYVDKLLVPVMVLFYRAEMALFRFVMACNMVYYRSSKFSMYFAFNLVRLLNLRIQLPILCMLMLRYFRLSVEPFYNKGAFMDSTGIVRAWVAGSGDASTSSTLKPIKRQTTKQLRFRSLITCERAPLLHRPCAGCRG
jgi:hypothetical protein